MCNIMFSSKLVGEIFLKSHPIKTARKLNAFCAYYNSYTSSLKQDYFPDNVCHLWKVQNSFKFQVHRSLLCTDTPSRNMKLRHDPDKFGDLSPDGSSEEIRDEGDIIEDNYVTYPIPSQQQLSIKQYADIIKEHVKKMQITEAVDVLETRMIKEDRVKPDSYIYSLLISACGRFGHTKKAFNLYNRMKQRQLTVPGAVYTALFNSCATCHDPQEGLKRAKHLQHLLVEKGVELNATHYNAMIKAYGRCGDLARAFQVADLMIDKQMSLNEEAFSFLLQACITDKKAGLRHALWVWHKMLQRQVKPSIYSFNLLLRCVRDCNLGEFEDVQKSLKQLTLDYGASVEGHMSVDARQFAIEDGINTVMDQSSAQTRSLKASWQFLPDLLSPAPRLQCNISSLDLTKPHERLLLLGGFQGVLRHMANFNIAPTIKTYTLLLDCLPPSIAAEKNLLVKMKKDGIPIDTEFCNMLIKKRSFRFDYLAAQDVLEIIKQEKLIPDIVTFGVLALACSNENEARDLISNMRRAGYRVNIEILGAMLKQGCLLHNFKYVMRILYLVREENIEVSPLFFENIKHLIASSRGILNKQAKGEELPLLLERKSFKKEFTNFMYKYNAWLQDLHCSNQPHDSRSEQRQK